MSCRVAVLISGSGTNLQALIDARQHGALGPAELVGVFSNRPGAGGLERAERAGIPTCVIDHRQYADRSAFDQAMQAALESWQPDLLVLAGFMRILTEPFVTRYAGRMLNIHPSLLPRYPGLNTHARALAAGDAEHGATIHFVTGELDGGPAILQARVPIKASDTAEQLAARVQRKEHQIYPAVVRWFSEGRLTMQQGHAYMDGNAIHPTGLDWDALDNAPDTDPN